MGQEKRRDGNQEMKDFEDAASIHVFIGKVMYIPGLAIR
jgi:hypothetical protein